jgi:hypothetical protein
MSLSQIWTLQAATGGDEKTLAEWGFSTATRSGAVQADDVVTLSRPLADAVASPDLWPWETELILRRDGQVYYRGYLATADRSLGADAEVMTYTLRSQWWLLSRLTYRQSWPALTGTGMGTVRTGRVRLGVGTGGNTVASMCAELSSHAAEMGVSLTFDLTDLPVRRIPPVEGQNRSVADLIRDIFRWFPDTALVPVYTESGTIYRARLSSGSPVEVLEVGGAPLADLDITPLYERQVDAVEVTYEAVATESVYDESTVEGEGGFSSRPRLAPIVDTYPVDAAVTRQTMLITLPYPAPPQGDATPVQNATPTPLTQQPIVSETWPTDGATDVEAQQWWLDRSSLGTYGLTVADVLLPSTSDETTLAHRVIIDPATITPPPSAVNPRSVPVWRPATPSDTPRELIWGALADWMPGRIKGYSLIAETTIAIKKSAVDAMSIENKASFLRLGPRDKTIADIPAYLLDCLYKFTGTNALTKVYGKSVSIDNVGVSDSAGAADASADSYAAAAALAIVPDLAQNLYNALSPLHYEGSCPLSYEEAPLTSYLGRRIALNHPDRPEWLTMAAQVSQETVDLASGRVGLTFGPPAHLGAQDWADLHTAARSTQARRTESAAAPQPVSNPAPAVPDEAETEPPRTAIVGGSITPKAQFQWQSGGVVEGGIWALEVVSGTTVKIIVGTILKGDDSVSAQLTCSNPDATFSIGAGDIIAAKITEEVPTTYELVKLSGWPETGGAAVTFSGTVEAGTYAFTARHYPLWQAVEASTKPGSVAVAASVFAERLVPSCHLVIQDSPYRTPAGEVVVAPRFGVSHQAITL